MTYPLLRDDLQYDLELTYEVRDFIPAAMGDGYRDDYNIHLTSAWCAGVVFPLTDEEIAAAEAWLMERVEV